MNFHQEYTLKLCIQLPPQSHLLSYCCVEERQSHVGFVGAHTAVERHEYSLTRNSSSSDYHHRPLLEYHHHHYNCSMST